MVASSGWLSWVCVRRALVRVVAAERTKAAWLGIGMVLVGTVGVALPVLKKLFPTQFRVISRAPLSIYPTLPPYF